MGHRLKELVPYGEKILREAGIDTPLLDSQLLLAHSLGLNRAGLLARMPDHIDTDTECVFYELLARRAAREPLAYITGVKEFYSLDFKVTPDVLIPRPETETIIDAAVEVFGKESSLSALDVGAGSGAIAVAMAVTFPRWKIMAVDSSEKALLIAQENAKANGVTERISFAFSDLFSAARGMAFDVIVSNPPYVKEGARDVSPEAELFEPHQALYAGPDGLDVVRRIIAEAPEYMNDDGTLMMEIDHDQAGDVKKLAEERGMYRGIKFFHDLRGIDRVFCARKAGRDG